MVEVPASRELVHTVRVEMKKTNPEPYYEGGCLCGHVRYRAMGEPESPHWCHCEMCRRATGAPAAAWGNFRLSEFDFGSNRPAYYESSPGIDRGFCPKCGGSICTLEQNDEFISILLGTLDEPDRIRPSYHIWTKSRVTWVDVNQHLPFKS